MNNNPIFYLEEVLDSVLKGVHKNVCSERGSQFKTFVLPNGDKVVFCRCEIYRMNQYDVPYWLPSDEKKKNKHPDSKEDIVEDETPLEHQRRRKRTRVFIYWEYGGCFNEIEEYAEDQIWIINRGNIELWNHQTDQLLKTINITNVERSMHESFVHFMKNGNIAVITRIANTIYPSCLCVYDPTRTQTNAFVSKKNLSTCNGKIKLVVETVENNLYFLVQKIDGTFEYQWMSLTKEENKEDAYTGLLYGDCIYDRIQHASLKEYVLTHSTNERDRRMLNMYRCYFKYDGYTYGVYAWYSGRTLYSDKINFTNTTRVTDVNGFIQTGASKTNMHVVSINHHYEPRVNFYYNVHQEDSNELWLASSLLSKTEPLDKVYLGSNTFNLVVLDTNTIVCVFPDSDARIFKICSR